MQKKTAFARGEYHSLLNNISRINWLFIMRLSVCCTAFLIFSLTLFASSRTSGQSIKDTRIELQVRHESLKSALQKLQDMSGFSVFYPSSKVNTYQNITLVNKSRYVSETLDLLLKGTNLDYRQDGNTIIITEKKIATPEASERVVKRITGIVVDETGVPLAGVTIRLKLDKMASNGTDINGHFQMVVNQDNDVLIFSFVGYQTQEVPVSNIEQSLRVVMKPAVGGLNEVQIIGYGSTTRRLNTGTVSSITSEEISKQPVQNPLDALQGRIAGAIVNQANGLPGARVTIQIRGQNSLSNGTQPLYIIDGVPFNMQTSISTSNDINSTVFSAANGGISPFSVINPNDIERLDILKDADATAIYGTRGSNGVVLITTKRGKAGKTKFDVNVYHGVGKVARFVDMMNIDQYLQLRKDAFANDGITPSAANAPDLFLWSQTQSTNWQQKYLGGSANTTDAQTTVSGGDNRTTFLLNVGYHNEGTVFPGDYGETRFSSRFSSQHKSLDNKLKISFSASYSVDKTNLPSSDLSSNVYNLPPNLPVNNADGTLYWNANFTNPDSYALANSTGKTNNLLSNAEVSYTILPGLDLKTTLGFTKISYVVNQQNPAISKNPNSSPTNAARFGNSDQEGYIIEPQANYTRDISKGKLSVLLGTTFQQSINQGTIISADNYSNPALLGALTGAGIISSFSTSYTLYKYNSVFGRINYDWMQKYILDINFRRDGSSRFGPDRRFGNFGSAGAAWIFSNEQFMHSLPFVSFGKIKASYGITGNDQFSDYVYLPLFSASSSLAYQGSSVLSQSRIGNPDLHWEENKKMEFGLELGFIKDRILLTSNYYRHRTSDQIGSLTLATQSGFNSYQTNFNALIQNSGFEFELNTTNIIKGNFEWKTSFNLTIPTTKLLAADPSYFSYNPAVIGLPLSVILRYNYLGVDPQTGLPLYKNQTTGASTLTPSSTTDRVPIGYTAPKLYGGISNSFRYKNFDLSFFIQFTKQMGNILTSSTPGTFVNQNTNWINRWRQPGDITSLPKATTNTSIYSSYSGSDAIWGDASYARLRNVYLSYAFPGNIMRKFKASQLRIFVQGQNLYTWTKNKYVSDPETIATTNQAPVVTPPLRVITTGLNVSF